MAVSQWGKEFDYQDAFKAIVDESYDKWMMSSVVGHVLSQYLQGQPSVSIADIGSDDGSTLLKLMNRTLLSGTEAITINALDSRGDIAEQARTNIQDELPLASVQAIQGNVYQDNVQQLLGERQTDVALVSHLVYGVSQSQVEHAISGIEQALSPDGVAVFAHVANTPGSLQNFHDTYGESYTEGTQGADKIHDTPEEIGQYCNAHGLKTYSLSYHSQTAFPRLTEEDWEAIKDPDNFAQLERKYDGTMENALRKLAFVVQKAPRVMAEEGTWAEYIDAVKAVVQANETPDHNGYLDNEIVVQFVPSREASRAAADRLETAVADAEAKKPVLIEQGRQDAAESRSWGDITQRYKQRVNELLAERTGVYPDALATHPLVQTERKKTDALLLKLDKEIHKRTGSGTTLETFNYDRLCECYRAIVRQSVTIEGKGLEGTAHVESIFPGDKFEEAQLYCNFLQAVQGGKKEGPQVDVKIVPNLENGTFTVVEANKTYQDLCAEGRAVRARLIAQYGAELGRNVTVMNEQSTASVLQRNMLPEALREQVRENARWGSGIELLPKVQADLDSAAYAPSPGSLRDKRGRMIDQLEITAEMAVQTQAPKGRRPAAEADKDFPRGGISASGRAVSGISEWGVVRELVWDSVQDGVVGHLAEGVRHGRAIDIARTVTSTASGVVATVATVGGELAAAADPKVIGVTVGFELGGLIAVGVAQNIPGIVRGFHGARQDAKTVREMLQELPAVRKAAAQQLAEEIISSEGGRGISGRGAVVDLAELVTAAGPGNVSKEVHHVLEKMLPGIIISENEELLNRVEPQGHPHYLMPVGKVSQLRQDPTGTLSLGAPSEGTPRTGQVVGKIGEGAEQVLAVAAVTTSTQSRQARAINSQAI